MSRYEERPRFNPKTESYFRGIWDTVKNKWATDFFYNPEKRKEIRNLNFHITKMNGGR